MVLGEESYMSGKECSIRDPLSLLLLSADKIRAEEYVLLFSGAQPSIDCLFSKHLRI